MNTQQAATQAKQSIFYTRLDMAAANHAAVRAARDAGASYKEIDKIDKDYNMIARALNDAERRVKLYKLKYLMDIKYGNVEIENRY